MSDEASQSNVNPGKVEQGLDNAPMTGQARPQDEADDSDGIRGGPIRERQRADGGQVTAREVFEGPGQQGRENAIHGARSGGSENSMPGNEDNMPGTSANANAARRDNPAPGGGLS